MKNQNNNNLVTNNSNTNREKMAMVEYVLTVIKHTPFPYSPKKGKNPVYFNGEKLTALSWSDLKDLRKLNSEKINQIKNYFESELITAVGMATGYNGEMIIGCIDFDRKNFDSIEAMNQIVNDWVDCYHLKSAPKLSSQSGGIHFIIGFKDVSNRNIFTFNLDKDSEKKLGEAFVGGHPCIMLGDGYEWLENKYAEIPVFDSPEAIGIFETKNKIDNQPKKINNFNSYESSEEAREALSYIPVTNFDDDYQGWINVGMACHAAGLNFEDWDNWSRGSKKYSTSKENLSHWNSFNNNGGITKATLFGFAKDNGWAVQNATKKINLSGEKIMKAEQETKKPNKPTEENIIDGLKKVESILLDLSIDEISKEIKINQIREDLGIDWKLWTKLITKVNKKIRSTQLELELKSLSLIDDKIKLTQGVQDLSEKYRIGINAILNLLKDLKIQKSTQRFESMNLGDFFDEVSETIDYLIPGLLPKGESALLVASPKVGKSLLAIDLAFAVATGDDYFLGEKTQKGKVLLISVDESKQSAKAKLVKRGFRKNDADNIKIVTQFEVAEIEKLESEIEDFRPSLVIIDSLKRITKGSMISENSAEFSDIIYSISELCNRYGSSCVLIHHSKKDNETIGVDNVRGSSAIVGACGNTWILNRIATPDPNNKKKYIFNPNDNRRQLYCYNRDAESKAFNLEFNPENNSWSVAGEVGISETDANERKTNKERILSIMRMNQSHHPEGMKGSFILDCLELEQPGAISKSSLYVELNRLVTAKIVGSKPLENTRGLLYFLHGYGNTTKTTQPDTSLDNSVYSENGNIPSPPLHTLPKCNLKSETTTTNDFHLGYIQNNIGYKLVTSNSCNQEDVTNEKTRYERVSDTDSYLVTSFGYTGGGGCAPNFVTNSDNSEIHTTKQSDTTFSDESSLENQIDFNSLVEGETIFNSGCMPYTLKRLTECGVWECTNGFQVTRLNIGMFHHAPKSAWS